ncbi:hypothetical protein HDV05_000423 [Chytridiales sp. JEL 0842]|nr:hypothetical protein HDV05_000423 [Chytridiales sp. JEL 0842]
MKNVGTIDQERSSKHNKTKKPRNQQHRHNKYLLVASLPRDSIFGALHHLADWAYMARNLNRTLVLPRVQNGFMSLDQPWPLGFYFDVEMLRRRYVDVIEFDEWAEAMELRLSKDAQADNDAREDVRAEPDSITNAISVQYIWHFDRGQPCPTYHDVSAWPYQVSNLVAPSSSNHHQTRSKHSSNHSVAYPPWPTSSNDHRLPLYMPNSQIDVCVTSRSKPPSPKKQSDNNAPTEAFQALIQPTLRNLDALIVSTVSHKQYLTPLSTRQQILYLIQPNKLISQTSLQLFPIRKQRPTIVGVHWRTKNVPLDKLTPCAHHLIETSLTLLQSKKLKHKSPFKTKNPPPTNPADAVGEALIYLSTDLPEFPTSSSLEWKSPGFSKGHVSRHHWYAYSGLLKRKLLPYQWFDFFDPVSVKDSGTLAVLEHQILAEVADIVLVPEGVCAGQQGEGGGEFSKAVVEARKKGKKGKRELVKWRCQRC